MKKRVKKLTLHRETLRDLSGAAAVPGPVEAAPLSKWVPWLCPSRFPCSNEISVCLGCTTPLDTCPDPTIA